MNEQEIYWIGIDVAKETFDAAVAKSGQRASTVTFKQVPVATFDRTEEGVAAFVTWLRKHVPAHAPLPVRAVMEATGAYSIQLSAMLYRACPELRPAIANPERTSAFRDSLGLRNKTDKLDARALAFYGLDRAPEAYEPMSADQAALRELSRCRDDLVASRTALSNRLKEDSQTPLVTKTLKGILSKLDKHINCLEQEMKRTINKNEDFKRDYDLLVSIPGVGFVTAAMILGELGDLRRFGGARQVAAHAGLTPAKSDSGKQSKPARMSKKGNGRVRQGLYMAALSALVYNEQLSQIYKRLCNNGKKPMVAVGAVMRKLLVLMRAVVVSGHPYDPSGKPKTCGQACG